MNPEQLLYNKSHEWVHVETDSAGAKTATIGITAFAVELLTDLVFVDLPAVGREVSAGEPFGEVESVKAVSDLVCPVGGQITEVNTALVDDLEKLSDDPFDGGWLVKVKITDESGLAGLLDYAAYQKQCAEEADQ